MNLPQGFELFAILAVLVLLFGSKKLPDAARSLGRSMRIFKSETKGLRGNDDQPTLAESDAAREQREFEEWKATRTDRSETR
jgi:sec-independent protein translocase protein TatA